MAIQTTPKESLRARIERLSGQCVSDCYQCGKCSGNCPVAPEMDYLPNQIMRLLMTGQGERALQAESVWLCDACLTCSSRCPRDIDIAAVMDALRALAPRDVDDTAVFADAFLTGIRRMGRANELPLALSYNLRRRKPFDNMGVGLKLLRKGKLPLVPRSASGVREILERVAAMEAEEARQAEGGCG